MTKIDLNLMFEGKYYVIPAGTPVDENCMITDVSFMQTAHEAEYFNIRIGKQFLTN
jgi:hypothetical protein